jgi:hypothetical protein
MAFIDDLLESGGKSIIERSEGIASLVPRVTRTPTSKASRIPESGSAPTIVTAIQCSRTTCRRTSRETSSIF